MRWLGWLVLLTVGAVLLAVGYRQLQPLWQDVAAELPPLVEQLQLETRTTTVYGLESGRWLSFPIPGRTRELRLLSQAAADSDVRIGTELVYGIEYELLDARGQLLQRGEQAHSARIPEPRLVEGHPVPLALYADTALQLATGQSFQLPLQQVPDAVLLRVRSQPLQAGIERLVLRTYWEERLTSEQAEGQWKRFNQGQREALVQALITPSELVTPQERINLLSRQWQPVGPQQVDAARYRLFLNVDKRMQLPSEAVAAGRYLAPGRMLVLPIAHAGKYHLRWQPQGAPGRVEWHRVDERYRLPEWSSLDLSREEYRHLEPGLLVLRSTVPGHFDLVAETAPERSALPPRRYLRSHPLAPLEPLRFELAPSATGNAGVRLDLRLHMPGVALPAQAEITAEYHIVDAAGVVLEAGTLSGVAEASLLDRSGQPEVADLSDPLRFYLRVPAGAAAIEMTSRHPLLASAYTRPLELPYRRQVSDDYRAWRDDGTSDPAWFLLRPVTTTTASVLLELQPRVPERNQDVARGLYHWQSLDIAGARSARLLVAADPETPVRTTALPGYFQPLPLSAEKVRLAVPAAAYQIRPELIYLRNSSEPFRLQMTLGEQRVEQVLSGRLGSIRLPLVAPGTHAVRLHSTAQGQWLLNYQPEGVTSTPGFMLRRAHWLPVGQTFKVQVHKYTAARQLFGARFYPVAETAAAPVVRLRVEPHARVVGPTTAWTHTERVYRLPNPVPASGHVLGNQTRRTAVPQSLPFLLAEDIADGPVTLHFTLEQGQGYLEVFELLPGEHAWSNTFEELQP